MYKYNVMGIKQTNTYIVKITNLIHLPIIFQGKFTQKMLILSSFTHPHAIPNLYEFSFSVKDKNDKCVYLSIQ